VKGVSDMADTAVPVAPALDKLKKTLAAAQAGSGTLTYEELVKALAPATLPETYAPAEPPSPFNLTEAQQMALARLPEVYGKVIVVERRRLVPAEIVALLEERKVLDELKRMAEKRQATIRTIVSIDMDLQAVASGRANGTLYDKDGHLILEGKVAAPDGQQGFVRSVRNKSAYVDEAALAAMDKAGEIPHEEYLAITEQKRVFNPERFMLYLKAHPDRVEALQAIVRPGSQYTDVRVGKP
jgi:hypothetical protein